MKYSKLVNQAIECYIEQSFKKALVFFKEANEIKEFETCEENYYFGVSFYKNRDFNNALKYLKKANEIKEFETCEENYHLGVSFHKNLDFNNAFKYLKKANEIKKFDNKWQFYFYGIALFKKSSYKEALYYFEKFHEFNNSLKDIEEFNIAVVYYENSCNLAFKKCFPYDRIISKKNKNLDEILYSMIYDVKYNGDNLLTIKEFNSNLGEDEGLIFLKKFNIFLESEFIKTIKNYKNYASRLKILVNQLHSKRLMLESTREKIKNFIINDKDISILNKTLLLEIFKFDEKDLTWFDFLEKEIDHCFKVSDFESIIEVYGFTRSTMFSNYRIFRDQVEDLSYIRNIIPIINKIPIISDQYNIHKNYRNSENIKNLTFVVTNLRGVGHNAHIALICDITNSIKKFHPNININMILTNENSVENIYNSNYLLNKEHYDNIKKFLKINNADYLNIYICNKNQDNSIVEQYFNYLEETKSDILIFLGGVFSSLILRRLSFNVLPVVFLPAQASNQIDNYNDFYIARNSEHLERLKLTLKAPEDAEFLMIPFSNMNLDLSEQPKSKRLEKDHFTVLTAVAGNRVADAIKSYSEKDMELLYTYIKKHKITWLLVGVSNLNTLLSSSKFMKMMHSEKIIEVKGFVSDLENIISQSDLIFIPPNITGGGTAINIGVKNRIPILITDICDGAGLVTKESLYGNTMESFIEKFDMFAHDEEYVKNAIEKAFKTLNNRSNSTLADEWVKTLNKVYKKFQTRE